MPFPSHKIDHKPRQASVLIRCSLIDVLDRKFKMDIYAVWRFDGAKRKCEVLGIDGVLQLQIGKGAVFHTQQHPFYTTVFLPCLLIFGISVDDADLGVAHVPVIDVRFDIAVEKEGSPFGAERLRIIVSTVCCDAYALADPVAGSAFRPRVFPA